MTLVVQVPQKLISEQKELLLNFDDSLKEKLVNFVGGDKTRIKELQKLMAFTSKDMMLTAFEDETFLAFVESITVESRTKIVFHLKCGLNLTERLVN